MAQSISVSAPVTGAPDKTFTLETGKLARQADGAVIGRIGGTYVLVTATAAKTVRERDSMAQERVPIDRLVAYLGERLI